MSANYNAQKMFDEGVAAYLRDDLEASVKAFSGALRHDAKFALAYASRGAAYLKSDRIKRAISDFNRAVRLDPGYARAYHLRGLAYEETGDLAAAYRDFDRAIELDPDLATAYRCRESVLDKSVDDCRQIAEAEMADHLAALRVAQLAGDARRDARGFSAF